MNLEQQQPNFFVKGQKLSIINFWVPTRVFSVVSIHFSKGLEKCAVQGIQFRAHSSPPSQVLNRAAYSQNLKLKKKSIIKIIQARKYSYRVNFEW